MESWLWIVPYALLSPFPYNYLHYEFVSLESQIFQAASDCLRKNFRRLVAFLAIIHGPS